MRDLVKVSKIFCNGKHSLRAQAYRLDEIFLRVLGLWLELELW